MRYEISEVLLYCTRDFIQMKHEAVRPIQSKHYGVPLPQKGGVGFKGLGWRFLTLTESALKEWIAIER